MTAMDIAQQIVNRLNDLQSQRSELKARLKSSPDDWSDIQRQLSELPNWFDAASDITPINPDTTCDLGGFWVKDVYVAWVEATQEWEAVQTYPGL